MNSFERILARLEASDTAVTEKTAEEKVAVETPAARMLAKVREISDAAVSDKTATAPTSTPTEDLQRLVEKTAELEQAAMVKEANFLGAAIADGFMTRFAAYDTALTEQGVKVATTTPDAVKQAAEAAYRQGQEDFQKQAETAYETGYQEQMLEVHKIASELHLLGQNTAREIVKAS